MKRIFFGFFIYFMGLKRWIENGSLLRLSVFPFFLDLVCLCWGIYYSATHVSSVVRHFLHAPGIWYQYIFYGIAYVLAALSIFLAVIFFLFIFANLIMFPINDRLARGTLRLHGIETKGSRVRNGLAMLERSAVLLGAGSILALASLLIPGFGAIAAAVGLFLMSCDRMDYAFDQYGFSFRQRLAFIRKHFPEVLGFSAAMGLTTAVPILNILLMPGGVVSGASLVAELNSEIKKGRPVSGSPFSIP